LVIAAICRREDVRDALVSRDGLRLADLPRGARIGTSSLRRQAQLRHRRPDLEFADVRGNVDTRLGKVARGEFAAVVLAKAGLQRLGMAERITEIIPPEVCLPAAGQGAIGIETRAPVQDADRDTFAVLALLDHAQTRRAVAAERAVLAGLSGGCDLPLGVWAREEASELVMDACVLSVDGGEAVRAHRSGAPDDSERIGRDVTAALLDGGADRLLALGGRSRGHA
jgi:hydroxymethylbilane synthase